MADPEWLRIDRSTVIQPGSRVELACGCIADWTVTKDDWDGVHSDPIRVLVYSPCDQHREVRQVLLATLIREL